MEAIALVVGVIVVVFIWALLGIISGTWNIFRFVQGADHRPSTSKFQWLLWTIVVLFSYAAIYAARVERGHFEALGTVPANVLIALGLTTATMAVAQGIAARQKQPAAAAAQLTPSSLGYLVKENDGSPDLSKAQMLAWTFIALGIYLLLVSNQIQQIVADAPGSLGLPDIDGALMVLMGLGQGGYVAKKIVSPP